ncbi:ammonium transporter, partial [Staphylococcus borealis]
TWVTLGFSLSFGTGNAFIGNFDLIGLQHVGFAVNDQLSPHIPFALFMLFQMMFCTIAVSILSGSIAERMKFFPFIIFIFLWVILIYSPVAHWVWGGGWIQQLGALDYAGGTVVHITSGLSGLILAIMIGNGKKIEKIQPHNLLITLIGGILVWIGWYGFNTGSAYTLNDVALTSFVNTIIAASGGAFSWLIIEYLMTKKISLLGLLSGVLAGLVAITPAAGYVNYFNAFVIAFAGGIVCYFVINVIKVKYKYNDTLDAFGIHGAGGIVGAILTGVFQSQHVNHDISNGFIYNGDIHSVLIQVIAVLVVLCYTVVLTWIIGKILQSIMPIATTEEEDKTGLDQLVHGEKAYFYGELNKLNKRY